MANVTCYNFQDSSFHLRNDCGKNETLWIFVSQAVVSFGCSVITFAKYNSINILNLNIHIDAISNTWWIFYFLVTLLKSILNSVKYVVNPNHIKALEIADWCIGTLKILILFFALNYQRKYRSTDRINNEIDSFSKSGKRRNEMSIIKSIKKALASSGLVLCTLALITWASIIFTSLYITTDNEGNGHKYSFWIYIGSISLDGLVSLFLAFMVITVKSSEGPHTLTKICLLLAVLFSVPSDLPYYLWKNCIFQSPSTNFCFISNMISFYDAAIFLNVISLFLFFIAMRSEFLRLKQECQWAMLSEVQRFSF